MNMKTQFGSDIFQGKKRIGWLLVLGVILLGGVSCSDAFSYEDSLYSDSNSSKENPNAIVTVKPLSDRSFYMQLDEKTTLWPVNKPVSPFGDKEVRALVSFSFVDEDPHGYSRAVNVLLMDSILTKPIEPDLGERNDAAYGKDPVEIVKDWITIVEDGYLTIRFRTYWGNSNKIHAVNLLTGGNPEDPYEVEFRHNAFNDLNGVLGDGLVAFRLDKLPDTKGETVRLRLRWHSFSGMQQMEFNYCTRQTNTGVMKLDGITRSITLQ